MKNLMVALYQRINNAHEYSTFQGRAPQGSNYPYVVYKLLPVQGTESNRDDYTLEVSCWDKAESTSHVRVVDLAEKVRKSLENFRHLDENQLIIVSRPNMGYIPDPDELIKRYDVTSTLLTYRR